MAQSRKSIRKNAIAGKGTKYSRADAHYGYGDLPPITDRGGYPKPPPKMPKGGDIVKPPKGVYHMPQPGSPPSPPIPQPYRGSRKPPVAYGTTKRGK